MATVNDKNETTSVISDEAYTLIGCFYDGVDEIVYKLAEEVARKRNPAVSPVQIEVDDVSAAGEVVMETLKRLFESGDISNDAREAIEGMGDCFENSSQ